MTRLLLVTLALALAAVTLESAELSPQVSGRLSALALDCVHREYPNKIAHVMHSDDDARPPRELTPAFYGCYDWHSAVHGHWLLARLARLHPDEPFAAGAKKALAQSLTPGNIRIETAYIQGEGRASFERPYGLAWLLQLAAELREWNDPEAARWAAALAPLEKAAVERVSVWLPKLSYPVRSGEHSQSAFALGLMLDYARSAGDEKLEVLLEERIRSFYLRDRDCPIEYEPSGEDFVSPCLAEADVVRRVLSSAAFAAWLGSFLPTIGVEGETGWLRPAVVTDATDGKLVHLDGLNLSRAWMLDGIASALPEDDPRVPAIEAVSKAHGESGLEAVSAEHYEGGHWLGSFATYYVTRRGIRDE
jgi:hypothetical protein